MTNRQAWAIALARNKQASRILYVQTIGWSPIPSRPRLVASVDGAEIFTMRAWNLVPRAAAPKARIARAINGRLTLLLLVLSRASRTSLVVLFDPFFGFLARSLKRDRYIYDCLDAYEAQPQYRGSDGANAIEAREREIATTADDVIAVSPSLRDRLGRYGARARCVPGALPTPVLSASPAGTAPPDTGGPRYVYLGALDEYKVDFRVFSALLRLRPDAALHIVGAAQYGEYNSQAFLDLVADPRVVVRSAMSRDEAIAYCAGFSAGIIAMTESRYSESSFPLKLWDYFWAGIPVLAVNVEAIAAVSPLCGLVDVPSVNDLDDQRVSDLERNWGENLRVTLRRQAESHSAERRITAILRGSEARGAHSHTDAAQQKRDELTS